MIPVSPRICQTPNVPPTDGTTDHSKELPRPLPPHAPLSHRAEILFHICSLCQAHLSSVFNVHEERDEPFVLSRLHTFVFLNSFLVLKGLTFLSCFITVLKNSFFLVFFFLHHFVLEIETNKTVK